MIKYSITIVLLAISVVSSSLSAQGIVFTNGSFEEILSLAKEEGKDVFVDVYTTWCAPCKKMELLSFTDMEVGKFFNMNFVNVRLDAENEVLHGFFSKFSTTTYPTFYWLNSDGELLDKHSGFMEPGKLLQVSNEATTKNIGAKYRELESRWNEGERSNTLFNEYVFGAMSTIAPEKVLGLTIDYLNSLTNEQLKSREIYDIIKRFLRTPSNNIIFQTLLSNWDSYLELEEDKDKMWESMYRVMVRSITANIYNHNQEEFEKSLELVSKLEFQHKDFYLESIKLESLIYNKEYELALDKILSLGEKYLGGHPYMYNQYLYTLIVGDLFIQENLSDSYYEKLLIIAKENAKYKPTQESMLILAATYAFNGNYKTAYEYLASLGFYPKPMLTNAVYSKLNLPIPREEYPWDNKSN